MQCKINDIRVEDGLLTVHFDHGHEVVPRLHMTHLYTTSFSEWSCVIMWFTVDGQLMQLSFNPGFTDLPRDGELCQMFDRLVGPACTDAIRDTNIGFTFEVGGVLQVLWNTLLDLELTREFRAHTTLERVALTAR